MFMPPFDCVLCEREQRMITQYIVPEFIGMLASGSDPTVTVHCMLLICSRNVIMPEKLHRLYQSVGRRSM